MSGHKQRFGINYYAETSNLYLKNKRSRKHHINAVDKMGKHNEYDPRNIKYRPQFQKFALLNVLI